MSQIVLANETDLSRRNFLGKLGAVSLAAAVPLLLNSSESLADQLYRSQPGAGSNIDLDTPQATFWERPRELWLYRNATKENIKATYWENGKINITGYVQACNMLRDVKGKSVVQMDVDLLNILYAIQGWLKAWGIERPIVINSGFRSIQTNESTEGSAKNSMHLYGKAADIWIPGISAEYLGRLVKMFSVGGVGFYISRGFIHVDSGRVRSWAG